jgi:glycosyltransferase involved in cell wall biosynthesis
MKLVYENVDCVILPTYSEGTSKSLLEAASMQLPILTSDIPGCNNIVINSYNGFLFKVKDVGAIINSINIFLSLDSKDKVLMGTRSREVVLKKFDNNIIINKYLDILNIVV